jgi:hypothetical protein
MEWWNMNTTNPKSKIQNPQSAAGLRPPQFGLRTLLLVVAACGVLLALRQWLSPIAVAALAFLAVSILLHIAGNVIGTRLRTIGDQPETQAAGLGTPQHHKPRPEDFAPATRLSVRQSLGWSIIIATLAGSALGGIGGGAWTLISSRGPINILNIGVGVVAFGVLGGMAAFGVVALVQVLAGAIWQALSSAPEQHPVRHRRG